MTNPVRSVTVIGGGMITHDQLLPSLYQLQREGTIGEIAVCGQRHSTLKTLFDSPQLAEAFPGYSFTPYPPASTEDGVQPELYREVIAKLAPGNIVVIALPDHVHFRVIMCALRANQHVITVKPMVLSLNESLEIEREATERGLVVGIEYHKRFDDRSLLARRRYREGMFGNFRLGTAALFEKWYYRHSNFQNWCTTDRSDAFTYIGCHYVDLVHFITGLLPTSVSLVGIREKYPNGNEGYLWTDARVRWENGAILNVQNGLGFPDEAPGTNTQGIRMYFSGESGGAYLQHDDQYRGLRYGVKPTGPGATQFAEPSPDYMQYVDLGGGCLTPVGYGVRAVRYLVAQCLRAAAIHDVEERRELLATLDAEGVMATPANSRYNESVIEAARLSLANDGREFMIADTVRSSPSLVL
jgi:D-galacturonate reductase